MQRVIYADVLVVTNIYITYILLKSAGILSKENPDKLRLFLSSFLGGIYSLTVLIPEKYQSVLALLRLAVMAFFVLVAFGYKSPKSFLRINLSFLLCSFLFAGIMLALWYFICPGGMYFNGSVVYFDIDILTLCVLTVVCYIFLKLFDRFFKSRAPVNTVFLCRVYYGGEEFELKAFFDTGNRLTDHFTGKPVIIVHRDKFGSKIPSELTSPESLIERSFRLLYCETVGGGGLLPAFSPDKVHIRGAEYDFTTESATIALTDKKLMQGEYDAILPMDLFDNNFVRKDETEDEKATAVF